MKRFKCMFALAAILGVGAMTPGCENTMNGSVDGDSVGAARDAIFDEVDVDLGILGEYHLVMVYITGVPNACEAWEEMMDIQEPNCEDYCEEWGEFANDYLGANTYWNMTLNLWAGNDVEDEYDQDDQPGEGEFTAVIDKWDVSALYDADECEDECEDSGAIEEDDEAAENGDVEVTKYDHKDLVKGNYNLDFGNDDTVSGQFKATHCDMGLDDWIWW